MSESMFRSWRFWAILVVLLGALRVSRAAELSTYIHDTVAALEAVKHPGAEDDLPYDVPEPARLLLTQLKHQLRDLIKSAVNAPQNSDLSAGELTATVLADLDRQGVPVGKEKLPKSQEYGGILEVKITQPHGYPDLLAATTTLQLPCAMKGDTSLYVFERRVSGWKLVLAAESDDYLRVDGAQDLFDYAISPRDGKGNWYVVTAHIPSWCTSCWSGGIHYRVLRPGPTAGAPRVLLNKDEGVYKCAEPPYKLALESAGFRIDYVAGEWLDFGLFTAIEPARYAVSGDEVSRVPPVAYTPQEFLNAWTQMPWGEARHWSNPERFPSLRSWHARLQPSPDKGYLRDSRFEFVQPCNSPATRWQIGLVADRFDAESPHVIFTVSTKKGAFNLDSIDLSRPPGCPGAAPASKTLDWRKVEELQVH